MTHKVVYAQPEDYDSMTYGQLLERVSRVIDPVGISIFADNINRRVDKLLTALKQCSSFCPLEGEVKAAIREFIEYARKSALLNSEAALWLQSEIDASDRIYGR